MSEHLVHGPALHDAAVIAAWLNTVGIPTNPATIRQWAKRGHIKRLGTGHNGAALYDPAEVVRHARRRSLHSV